MTERAEALRCAVSKAVLECVPDMDPLDSDEAAHVLRAVVEEIGEPVAWSLELWFAGAWDRNSLTISESEAHAWGDHDPKGREQGFYRAVPLHDVAHLLEAAGPDQ